MPKKEVLTKALEPLFAGYLRNGVDTGLRRFALENSNLPGPRGNIELGLAFADVVRAADPGKLEHSLSLCASWIEVGPVDAPGDSPAVMLPFCGALGVAGVSAAACETGRAGRRGSVYDRAFEYLYGAASDPRWRVREACAMGLQILIFLADTDALDRLEARLNVASWLELRAVVAAVADHLLRGRQVIAQRSIGIHSSVMERVQQAALLREGPPRARRPLVDDGFDTLCQGLGFSLSVVVAETPRDGFRLLRRFAVSESRTIRAIVRDNLSKKRLSGPYPEETASVKELLERTDRRDN